MELNDVKYIIDEYFNKISSQELLDSLENEGIPFEDLEDLEEFEDPEEFEKEIN